MLWELPKRGTEVWSKCCWKKMVLIVYLIWGSQRPLIFKNAVSARYRKVKHSKMRCACIWIYSLHLVIIWTEVLICSVSQSLAERCSISLNNSITYVGLSLWPQRGSDLGWNGNRTQCRNWRQLKTVLGKEEFTFIMFEQLSYAYKRGIKTLAANDRARTNAWNNIILCSLNSC